MLKIILTIIIIYIIIEHLITNYESDNFTNCIVPTTNNVVFESPSIVQDVPLDVTNYRDYNIPSIDKPIILNQASYTSIDKNTNTKVYEFDSPTPWSRIMLKEGAEYPLIFSIKIKIPSLNDYQAWKQIIPNLEFDPQSGLLLIPSKDEASALALANLLGENFLGNISIKDIIEKELIQISISKAQTHPEVVDVLRNQIIDSLYGKNFDNPITNFEAKIVKKSQQTDKLPVVKNNPTNLKSDGFKDTFEHFGSATNFNSNSVEASISGNDNYVYL
jgi:hypothetical protein